MTGAALLRCLLLSSLALTFVAAKKELKLLHVLSANKFYVPDYDYPTAELQVPSNLTYKYFIENALDVPNSVKMHLYNLGVHLRNMYGDYLGSIYVDEIIRMQTTEYPASIIAGELINAGLWPPVEPQIWKDDLPWQPVPFVYTPAIEDTVLLGSLCSNFEYETHKILKNHLNLTTQQTEVIDYIRTKGHVKVKNPIHVSLLYLVLQNSIEINKRHPDWVKQIFPGDALLNVTLTAYELLSKTTVQKRLNGGSLLKHIIKESKERIKGTLHHSRKINVFSGDDRNLAGVLSILNISMFDLPSPGAALIFELFEEDGNHFFKINYYTGSSNDTIPYKLEGCDLFCPVENFTDLVADYLPENELSLCGSLVYKPPGMDVDSEPDGASTLSASLTFLSVFVVYLGTKI